MTILELEDAQKEIVRLRRIIGFFAYTAERHKMEGLKILGEQLKMKEGEILVLVKRCEMDYILIS